eukprot:6177783-Pleurochrysis_carterae.AAC.1
MENQPITESPVLEIPDGTSQEHELMTPSTTFTLDRVGCSLLTEGRALFRIRKRLERLYRACLAIPLGVAAGALAHI